MMVTYRPEQVRAEGAQKYGRAGNVSGSAGEAKYGRGGNVSEPWNAIARETTRITMLVGGDEERNSSPCGGGLFVDFLVAAFVDYDFLVV